MFSVYKFGGSSVADATATSRVLDIIGVKAREGRLIVVGSAIGGCTDALLAIAEGIAPSSRPESTALLERHLGIIRRLFTGAEREAASDEIRSLFDEMLAAPDDEKVTFGELFSTRILAQKLAAEGFRTRWLDSRKLIIDGQIEETYRRIREAVQDPDIDIFVAPGFIAGTPDGHVTTLGRGGSDYSAALYAAAAGADALCKWTDVPGMMTADRRKVPAARTIPFLSYSDAETLALRGAKVLYAPAVKPAMEAGIPIHILNTFCPSEAGTVISAAPSTGVAEWLGVSAKDHTIYLTCSGDGTLSSHTTGMASGEDAAAIHDAAARLEKILRAVGIAPKQVRCTERGVEADVKESVENAALIAIHREFFETAPVDTVDLFIAGAGAVGKALVDLIGRSRETVEKRTGKALRILGIADSRHYVVRLAGIRPEEALQALGEIPGTSPGMTEKTGFVEEVLRVTPKGAVFVDCTDSTDIYHSYTALMEAGLHVVSSNRRSLAVPFVEFAAMKAAALQNGVFFRYETTVGAALPILESISRGANTCDEVISIEAVVSCTLNQILGEYTPGGPSFARLLRKAQESGLTEADPRQDLDGRDALRKILILGREAGLPLEEADVEVTPLIPEPLDHLNLEAFYKALEGMEPVFAKAFERAAAKGCRRRFVASIERDASARTGYRACIRMADVEASHPAYHLRGTENAIIVQSAFHPYPLVIQGAGEGARQAASSILNDILR